MTVFVVAGWALLAVPLLWWLDEDVVRHAWQAALLGAGLAVAAFVVLIGTLLEPSFSRMASDGILLAVATIGAAAGTTHYALRRTHLRQALESRRRLGLTVLWLAPLAGMVLTLGVVGATAVRLFPCQAYAHGPMSWRAAAYDRLARDLARHHDYTAARAACPTLFPPPVAGSAVEVVHPEHATGRRFGWRFRLAPDERTVVTSDMDYLDP